MINLLRQWFFPLLCNYVLLLAGYVLCRIIFLLENWSRFSDLTFHDYGMVFIGGLRFDWSAICYVNSLYLVLQIVVFLYNGKTYQKVLKWIFVCSNMVCWGTNLADSVYFDFIKRRATMSVFREFAHDNISSILGIELLNHWYLLLLLAAMTLTMWRYYRIVSWNTESVTWIVRCITVLIMLVICVFMTICGIRGGIDPELRPINNKDAKEYIANPMQSALVLNTPFSLLRTLGKQEFPQLKYYDSVTLEKIYTPIHPASKGRCSTYPNIVIIIMESFSSEYSALLNYYANGEGYMPFLDSLMLQSRYYEQSFANGKSSIDGQASILASIPMMVESFFTSHASMNTITGLANELKQHGYTTAFFHGADNGSLSIDGFTKSVGFDTFYGRTEYGDDTDWDHHWGIWDEPFMQYFGREIGKMKEPFAVGIFTLTSHHPFQIPKQYEKVFKGGELPVYKTIEYADMSLSKFFNYAKQQTWYEHTLFVITGDHINQTKYPYYNTSVGTYSVPIIFFHPNDSVFQGGRYEGVAHHIDIMPTILNYVGAKRDYLAFGKDLLSISPQKSWAVHYNNGIYQLVDNHLLLQFDGETAIGLYQYKKDPMLENNLLSDEHFIDAKDSMEKHLKGIIQSYMFRMNNNLLIP